MGRWRVTAVPYANGEFIVEHRWGTRHVLDVLIRLDARPHLLAFARLRNASSSGAYVEVAAAPPLMTRIHIELDWESLRRDEPHRIAAYVVRDDGAGIGLEWCEFAPRPILALMESRPARARPQWTRSSGRGGTYSPAPLIASRGR